MKYLIFLTFLATGVPAMAIMAMSMRKMRMLLLAGLVASSVLGARASINFISMEHYRGPDRGYELTLTDLLAWALCLALVMKFPQRIKWIPVNTFWMLVFFISAIISVNVAPDRLVASFTLAKLVRLYIVYWCVYNVLRIDEELWPVCLGMVGMGLFLTMLAVQQKYLYGMYRVHGPFDHSNTIPMYANLAMPSLVIWALCDPRLSATRAAITMVAALGMVFSILATGSRAGTALAGACLLAALFTALMRHPARRVYVASGVVLVGMVLGGLKAADTYIYRFKNAPKASAEARDEFNYAAELMARDNTFGVGLNSFSKVLTERAAYRQHIQVMGNEEHAGVCHHIYWLTAAEMGYPGLVIFCIMIVRFQWLAVRGALRSKSLEGLTLIATALGMGALHLTGFLEWALRITPVSYQFVVVAGLTAWCAESVRNGSTTEDESLDMDEDSTDTDLEPAPSHTAATVNGV